VGPRNHAVRGLNLAREGEMFVKEAYFLMPTVDVVSVRASTIAPCWFTVDSSVSDGVLVCERTRDAILRGQREV